MTEAIISRFGQNVMTTSIEVKINTLTGKYYLPDSDILRGKKIIALFTLKNPNNDRKAVATQRDLISDIALRNAYITLQADNLRFIEEHPLEDFAITEGDRAHRFIVANGFNPTKSYISFADTAALVEQQSIILQFIYQD